MTIKEKYQKAQKKKKVLTILKWVAVGFGWTALLGCFVGLVALGCKGCANKKTEESTQIRIIGDFDIPSNRIDMWDYSTSTYGNADYNQKGEVIRFINPVEYPDSSHDGQGVNWYESDIGSFWNASYLFADYCWRVNESDNLPQSLDVFGDNFLRVQYNSVASSGLNNTRGGLAPMWYVKIVFTQSDYFLNTYEDEVHNIFTIGEIILKDNKITFYNQNERYHFSLPYFAFYSGHQLTGDNSDFPFFRNAYHIYAIKEFHLVSYRWFNRNLQNNIITDLSVIPSVINPLMITYAKDSTSPSVCDFFTNNFYKTKYYLPRTYDFFIDAYQDYVDERKLPYYTNDPSITKVYELGEVPSDNGSSGGVIIGGNDGLMGVFSLIGMAFTAIGGFLSYQIVPGISIGTLFVLPIVVSLVFVIVWLFKR